MVFRGYLFTALRSIVIVLNLNFVVFGVVLCIFGLSQRGSVSQYEGVVGAEGRLVTLAPFHFLLAASGLSFLSGVFGLRGVDRAPLLMIYGVGVTLIAVFHVGVALSTESVQGQLQYNLEKGLTNTMMGYNNRSTPFHKSSWDKLQKDLRCCGVEGLKDWETEPETETALISIPGSCFPHEDQITEEELNSRDFVSENAFGDGCLQRILDDIGIKRLLRVSIILATAEFIAAFCSCYLLHCLRQDNYGDYWRNKI